MSKSQLKKQQRAAANAALKDEQPMGMPELPIMPDPKYDIPLLRCFVNNIMFN